MKIHWNDEKTAFIITDLPDGSNTEILEGDVDVECEGRQFTVKDGTIYELILAAVESIDNVDLDELGEKLGGDDEVDGDDEDDEEENSEVAN